MGSEPFEKKNLGLQINSQESGTTRSTFHSLEDLGDDVINESWDRVNQKRANTDHDVFHEHPDSSPSLSAQKAKTKEEEVAVKSSNSQSRDPSPDTQAHIPYTYFSKDQRLIIFGIIIFIGFLGPMSGNIYIPALPLLQREYDVSATTINATVSVFMAVFSVGPLFWGALADFGGRKFLYMVSLSLMLIVNILLAAVPVNIAALFVLRIFQAFASSSVISLGAGTVTDVVPPKHRGKAIAYFMMGPNMGPIIAPIVAGLILMKGNYWRWLFGFTSIMTGIALILVTALLPETLRCIVGNGDPKWGGKKGERENNESPFFEGNKISHRRLFPDIGIRKPVNNDAFFQENFPKPPKAGWTLYWKMIKCPPIIITSVSTALLFSSYYAFSVTFSYYLEHDYRFTMLEIGAAYVCPGVAMLLGSQSGGHLSDYLRSRWIKSHSKKKFPAEFRLLLNLIGILLTICGTIGYGWAIFFHYHFVVLLVFSALTAFGMTWCSNTSMTYLTELFPKRAAGTVAVSSFFRNVGAAISSAIILQLCNAMGIGWCFTGLGLCSSISLIGILYLLIFQRKYTAKEF
ncbi:Dtr1p [Saccharomyces cerevisiae YJM195]|nr:Dtr1p [Saccharomyces cerevisiae YJM195]